MPSPAWWKYGILYEVYPRSFQDTNGDGIGDLQGILKRLDYLADLGIKAVWIAPFYPSPMADFGYDIADYCNVDPIFGNLADFDELLLGIHERGLKLILDHYARVRDGKDDAAHGNQAALLALAKHPNVAVKCTGAPGNSSQPYPYSNIHKYTQQIVETFGPQRSFWGTDITRMPCSWKECVTMFTEEMSWLKGRDLELVMGRALCDWIGWKLPD